MSDNNCVELRDAITASVQRNLSDAVLLSGGLDSSIIASIAVKLTSLTGLTAVFENAPDLMYAKILAKKYSIKHLIKRLSDYDVNKAMENVVRIMKSFDPMEIRNTCVIYVSLRELRDNGFRSVMTGDGGDELFAGYNYMQKFDVARLKTELKKIWREMAFSSGTIGKELKMRVKSPYLEDSFLDVAKRIPIRLKIKEQNGIKWGKWILRSCFEDDVTQDVAWRKKMPLEEGAGINLFTEHFHSTIKETDFAEKIKWYGSNDSVKIRDREHLHYYTIYRKFFDPPKTRDCEFRCPDCLGCVRKDSRFCRTCGAFPIEPKT